MQLKSANDASVAYDNESEKTGTRWQRGKLPLLAQLLFQMIFLLLDALTVCTDIQVYCIKSQQESFFHVILEGQSLAADYMVATLAKAALVLLFTVYGNGMPHRLAGYPSPKI